MDERDEMLIGAFKYIAMSHFHDHKMSGSYCRSHFNRSLGQRISNYVKDNYPEVYAKQKETCDRALAAETKQREEFNG